VRYQPPCARRRRGCISIRYLGKGDSKIINLIASLLYLLFCWATPRASLYSNAPLSWQSTLTQFTYSIKAAKPRSRHGVSSVSSSDDSPIHLLPAYSIIFPLTRLLSESVANLASRASLTPLTFPTPSNLLHQVLQPRILSPRNRALRAAFLRLRTRVLLAALQINLSRLLGVAAILPSTRRLHQPSTFRLNPRIRLPLPIPHLPTAH